MVNCNFKGVEFAVLPRIPRPRISEKDSGTVAEKRRICEQTDGDHGRGGSGGRIRKAADQCRRAEIGESEY